MIDIQELLELIKTKAIDTYKGEVDVLVDRFEDLVVIQQGDERKIIMSVDQTEDMIVVLINRLSASRDGRSRYG